jgi:hypothetical protein
VSSASLFMCLSSLRLPPSHSSMEAVTIALPRAEWGAASHFPTLRLLNADRSRRSEPAYGNAARTKWQCMKERNVWWFFGTFYVEECFMNFIIEEYGRMPTACYCYILVSLISIVENGTHNWAA